MLFGNPGGGGVWRSPYVRFNRVGGWRRLMYDEMFGSFILLLGSPGQQPGQESESGLSGLGVVWQVRGSVSSLQVRGVGSDG